MTREEAIEIIKKYTNEKLIVTIPIAFPYEVIPAAIKNMKDYNSKIEVRKEILMTKIKHLIKWYIRKAYIVKLTFNEIQFSDTLHNYFKDIEKLATLQDEFDLVPMENKDNQTIFFQISAIKDLEDQIIERAIFLNDIVSKINLKIDEYKNKIQEITEWTGEL